MRKTTTACLALVVVCLVSVCTATIFAGTISSSHSNGFSSAQPSEDSWPMWRRDLAHTGNSNSAAPDTNRTLWKFNTGGQVGSPAVVGGVVYAGSYDHLVYAIGTLHITQESTDNISQLMLFITVLLMTLLIAILLVAVLYRRKNRVKPVSHY